MPGLKQRIKCRCKACGNEFETIPSRVKNGRGIFCSKKCHLENLRIILTKKLDTSCEICGKPFMAKRSEAKRGRARFCSRQCCNVWQKEMKQKPRERKPCRTCGKEMYLAPWEKARRLYCSRKCADALKKPPQIHASKGAKRRPGTVYVLQITNGLYKIGFTTNLKQRLARLSSIFPYKLELIHAIETDDIYLLEKELHMVFSKNRVRGEWFDLDDSNIETIRCYGTSITYLA